MISCDAVIINSILKLHTSWAHATPTFHSNLIRQPQRRTLTPAPNELSSSTSSKISQAQGKKKHNKSFFIFFSFFFVTQASIVQQQQRQQQNVLNFRADLNRKMLSLLCCCCCCVGFLFAIKIWYIFTHSQAAPTRAINHSRALWRAHGKCEPKNIWSKSNAAKINNNKNTEKNTKTIPKQQNDK